jgi:hypothetical protein
VERVVYTPSAVGNQVVFCSKAHFFMIVGMRRPFLSPFQ